MKVDEESDNMTNIDSIGDFYYFSFKPLDDHSTIYKRFAIFPDEYVCIVDESQMEKYKSNKVSYAQDKTIYIKGEAMQKAGNEFLCVKTPSQFAEM